MVRFRHAAVPTRPLPSLSKPKRPYWARNDSGPAILAPASTPARSRSATRPNRGHGERSVVDGDLGVVAGEPAQAARLRRRREQHEVHAGTVRAEEGGRQIDGVDGVVQLRGVLGELVGERGEQRRRPARRARANPRRSSAAAMSSSAPCTCGERLGEGADGGDVDPPADGAEGRRVDLAQGRRDVVECLRARLGQLDRRRTVLGDDRHHGRTEGPGSSELLVGLPQRAWRPARTDRRRRRSHPG